MGKIHDAYGGMDVEVTKSVTLSVECGANYCQPLSHTYSAASQESWYSPTATDLQGRFNSPKWLGDEKLTKPRFYRHLLDIGWTLVELEYDDQNDWVWLCPACSKGGE